MTDSERDLWILCERMTIFYCTNQQWRKWGHLLSTYICVTWMRTHIVWIALRTFSEVLVDSTPNPESALEDFLALRIESSFLVQRDGDLWAKTQNQPSSQGVATRKWKGKETHAEALHGSACLVLKSHFGAHLDWYGGVFLVLAANSKLFPGAEAKLNKDKDCALLLLILC